MHDSNWLLALRTLGIEMSLADIVRSGVSLANSITSKGALQERVTLRRWNGIDGYAQPSYATALTLDALVEHSAKRVKDQKGDDAVATTVVTFLAPIPPLSPAVTGREEPVDERDLLVTASGRSGPILRKDGGLHDPTTSRPYVLSVYLG